MSVYHIVYEMATSSSNDLLVRVSGAEAFKHTLKEIQIRLGRKRENHEMARNTRQNDKIENETFSGVLLTGGILLISSCGSN